MLIGVPPDYSTWLRLTCMDACLGRRKDKESGGLLFPNVCRSFSLRHDDFVFGGGCFPFLSELASMPAKKKKSGGLQDDLSLH